MTTTNRHCLFLRELVEWFVKQVPGMPPVDWRDFIYEDDRDAREQRDAYSEEEGTVRSAPRFDDFLKAYWDC